MPNIQFKLTNTDHRSYTNDRITIPASGQTVWLRPPTDEQLEEIGMTSSSVQWEMLQPKHRQVGDSHRQQYPWHPGGLGQPAADGRPLGTYRPAWSLTASAGIPPPPRWRAKTTPASQKLEVTSDCQSMEVDKNNSAIFTYAPVHNSGDWGARWYPGVIVYKDNVPKAFYDAMYAWSENEKLSDGGVLVSMNKNGKGQDPTDCKLFSATAILRNKDAMVPGNYTPSSPVKKVELASGVYAPRSGESQPHQPEG